MWKNNSEEKLKNLVENFCVRVLLSFWIPSQVLFGEQNRIFPANICWSWRPSRHVWRRLQHVLSVTILRLPRRIEDVWKTCWRHLARRLEDVLEDQKLLRWRRLEDMSWRCLEDMSWKRLEDIMETSKILTGDICI